MKNSHISYLCAALWALNGIVILFKKEIPFGISCISLAFSYIGLASVIKKLGLEKG